MAMTRPEPQAALMCCPITEADISRWPEHIRERIERGQPRVLEGAEAGVQVYDHAQHGVRDSAPVQHYLLHSIERPQQGRCSRPLDDLELVQRAIAHTHMTVTLLTCIGQKLDCRLLERMAMRQMARNLQTLVLEDCCIADQDVGFIAAGLSRLVGREPMSKLRALALTNNFITAKGAEHLAAALQNATCLEDLYLDWNRLGSQGCTFIAAALKCNTSLKLLHMAANDLRDAGIISLADALKGQAGLTDLDLTTDNVTATGATALADMLRVNSTLCSLSLNGNSIGAAGGCALAAALNQCNSTLGTLCVDSCDATTDVFIQMATSLRSPACGLSSFSASRNAAHDAGALAVAHALGSNTMLTKLRLARCGISEEALSDILQVAGSVGNLLELDVRDNAGQDRSFFLHNPHANKRRF